MVLIKLFLLFLLTFCLYLNSINNNYFVFDDRKMVACIKDCSWYDFILAKPDIYWRPLLGLSYYFDNLLFDMSDKAMHFVNIFIHTFNTIMVFFICRAIFIGRGTYNHDLCLLFAVLFAAHPINTESINWISGRTDPLAACFALFGIYFFIQGYFRNTARHWLASSIFLFLGCLSKESVSGLYLAAFLTSLLLRKSTTSHREAFRRALPFLIGGLIYGSIRVYGYLTFNSESFSETTSRASEPEVASAWNALAGFGFYIKKLLIPTPLNFAIDAISPYYALISFIAIASYFYFLAKSNNTLLKVILTFFVISLVPPLVNAAFYIAWTPFAERYLYLPLAITVIALACLPVSLLTRKAFHTTVIIFTFVYFLPTTIMRNLQWADQISFIEYTATQVPDNQTIRTILEKQATTIESSKLSIKEFSSE